MLPTMTGPVWMPIRTRKAGGLPARPTRLSAARSSRICDGGADGCGGMALQPVRSAEEGHHAVAEEFVDRAAMRVDGAAQYGEMTVQELRHRRRVHLLRQRGEVGDVGEHDRDDRLARLGDADLAGAHQLGDERARNIGGEGAQPDQHGVEGRGLVVQFLDPAARQRRHAVKVEIGDTRRLSGDRLDGARKTLAEQDRDDDRGGHRGKPEHGRCP